MRYFNFKINTKYYLLFLSLTIVLFFRLGNIHFADGRYLWAEDGNIFINQALSLGLHSIFTPYAGYLHLYPRLIALFAVNVDLMYLPIILFFGWVFAVLFTSYVIFKFLLQNQVSYIFAYIVIILIFLQPNSVEVFFTITNTQWFLALSLVIIILQDRFKFTLKNFIIVITLGLTGPFSILLLPLVMITIWFKKDFIQNIFKYLTLLSTAAIQIYFILGSNRIGGNTDLNIYNLLESLYIFFTFGSKGYFALFGLILWGLIFISILYSLFSKEYDREFQIGLIIFITLWITYIAGLWACKFNPLILSPLGGGARYYIIPYSLMLISLPFLIKNKIILSFIFFLFTLISLKNFVTVNRSNLHFQSYAWMSKQISSLTIPIHPQSDTYPIYYINYKTNNIKKNSLSFTLHVKKTNYTTSTNDTQIIFDIPNECLSKSYLGIEFKAEREKDGWVQIFYKNEMNDFSESNSTKRFYPNGEMLMQFAFKNKKYSRLRIDISDKKGVYIKMSDISLYCGGGSNEK